MSCLMFSLFFVTCRAQPPGGKCSDLFGNFEQKIAEEKTSDTSTKEAVEKKHVAEQQPLTEKEEETKKDPAAEKEPEKEGKNDEVVEYKETVPVLSPKKPAPTTTHATTEASSADYVRNKANAVRSTSMW